VGAGNSDMSSRLYDAGYTNLVNIDISESVIKDMRVRYPKMVWEVMDATKMTYTDDSFDLAIDKGTIDALRAGQQKGDVLGPLVKEVFRVVSQGRPFIVFSHSGVVPHSACTADVLHGKGSSKPSVYVHDCLATDT